MRKLLAGSERPARCRGTRSWFGGSPRGPGMRPWAGGSRRSRRRSCGSGFIQGTDGDDVIFGSPGTDIILARRRDDIICGNGGRRLRRRWGRRRPPPRGGGRAALRGPRQRRGLPRRGRQRHPRLGSAARTSSLRDDGDDDIIGFGGDDRIVGGDGDDTAFGGPGDDFESGGDGARHPVGQLRQRHHLRWASAMTRSTGTTPSRARLRPVAPRTRPRSTACFGGDGADSIFNCERGDVSRPRVAGPCAGVLAPESERAGTDGEPVGTGPSCLPRT